MTRPYAATFILTGVDGSTWHLSGPGQGAEGVELGTSPSGFYDAPVTTIWNKTAFQQGATFGGDRTEERHLVFSVNVFAIAGIGWEHVDSAWRKAWSYEADSTLTVTTESGTRSLKFRLAQAMDFGPTHDPHNKQLSQYVMTCIAGVPWWTEADMSQVWVSPIDTTGGRISTGSLLVENATDQPMWLRWTLSAPAQWKIPDFSWGSDYYGLGTGAANANRAITMPRQAAGQDLDIDTDPQVEEIVAADGSNFWAAMNGISFEYNVPPHTPSTSIPVAVTFAPAGASVLCIQPRNWSRPWGLT